MITIWWYVILRSHIIRIEKQVYMSKFNSFGLSPPRSPIRRFCIGTTYLRQLYIIYTRIRIYARLHHTFAAHFTCACVLLCVNTRLPEVNSVRWIRITESTFAPRFQYATWRVRARGYEDAMTWKRVYVLKIEIDTRSNYATLRIPRMSSAHAHIRAFERWSLRSGDCRPSVKL